MIETIRHDSVFNAEKFDKTRVDVIGTGATGSKIALNLAKLGIQNLHIWDFDYVEAHNIANQAFGLLDIGKPKVEALAEIIKIATGISVTPHEEAVTNQRLGSYVFLLTDTMASRKEIFTNSLKNKRSVQLMIETRMGVDQGQVYAINPSSPTHIREWEATLFDDEEVVEPTACQAVTVVGSTAEMISGIAVWRFLDFLNQHTRVDDNDYVFEHELIIGLNPITTLGRVFE